MRVLLDTNRYRDFCENVPEAVDVLRRAQDIYLSFATLAELRAGFLCGTLSRRNDAVLVRFLNRPRVHTCFPDTETTLIFAALFAQLRRQGTPIPTHDIWIAALAMQHDLILFTRDAHFDALPQVPRVT